MASITALVKSPLFVIVCLVGMWITLFILYPYYSNQSVPHHRHPTEIHQRAPDHTASELAGNLNYHPLINPRLVMNSLQMDIRRRQREKKNGDWYSLGANYPGEGFIYTAFYDDRHSLGTLPVVRVIAVLEALGNDEIIYCSLFFYKTNRFEHVRVRRQEIGNGDIRHGKHFKEFILTCQMNHENIPDTVGIISNTTFHPSVMIPLEIPDHPAEKHEFGVCVPVTFWKLDPYRVVEWAELLRIMGVTKVLVYNNSMDYQSARVFEEYDKEGFFEFRQSHNFMPDPGYYTLILHSTPVINDCMYRNMYSFKKIIVIDLDELIIPKTVESYTDLLWQIDKKQGATPNHPAVSYSFTNQYFFTDTPGEDKNQSKYTTSLRHRMKAPLSDYGYSIKSIIDPLACQTMHNHLCWKKTPLYDKPEGTIDVDPELAVNQHYKKCHFETRLCNKMKKASQKDDTMMRFKTRLELAMSNELARFGLNSLYKPN